MAKCGRIYVFGICHWWLRILARFKGLKIFCSNLYDHSLLNRENCHLKELEGQGVSCHLISIAQTIAVSVVAQDESTQTFQFVETHKRTDISEETNFGNSYRGVDTMLLRCKRPV